MREPAVLFGFIFVLIAPLQAALGGEIQGRVRNAQGGAVAGATVTAVAEQDHSSSKAVTERDGMYRLEIAQPGVYLLTVSTSSGQPALRRQVSIAEPSGRVRVDFQFLPEATQLSGAEERNPNIFINRIDWNDLRNRLMSQRGPDPQYVPELKPEQNYFGAEFGAPMLAFEGIRPRPMLSRWHGALSVLHQNSPLNARNFFNVGRLLPSRSTTYDITAEGPITPQKFSVFLDFNQALTSGFVNGNVQAPLATERTPFATNPQVNTIIRSLLSAYPADLPNLPYVSKRQLNSNAERGIDGMDGVARLDWKISPGTSAAFRYFANQYSEDPFQIIIGQNPHTDLRYQGLYSILTRNLSSNTVGRFGLHYDRARARLDVTKEYANLFSSLGLPIVPDVSLRAGSMSSMGPGKLFPRFRVTNRYQVYAEVAKNTGRHTLTAGWGMARSQVNDLQSDNVRGAIVFASDFGNDEVTNFLQGRPSSFTLSLGNLYRGFRNWDHYAYFGDQIRLRPDFSVSVGLRYELMTVPTEVNHLTDIKYPTDKTNFAPRFGFAWNPRRGKATVRGAYGISYSTIYPVTYGMERFNPPAVQVIQLQAPDLSNLVSLLATATPTSGGRTALFRLSPDLAFPYSQQYSLGIERQVGAGTQLRIAYFGSRSLHLLALDIYNRARAVPGVTATTANVNDRRPDPRYFDVNLIEGNGIAYYDAFQASVNKRLWHGLAFRAAYTFGKNIDFDSDFTTTASGAENPPDIGTPTCELCSRVSDQKGPSLFDTPHALVLNYNYNLPFPRERQGWTAALLRGWQISGATIAQSGGVFHLHTGSDGPGFGNVDGTTQDRPNILNTSLLHQHFNNPDTAPLMMGADTCKAPPAVPYLQCKNFDTNIPAGGRGTLGMNTFRKSGTYNWNVALARGFRLPGGERTLQFRAEFYNLLNRPQFMSPGIQLSSENFGKIINTSNKGRQVQFQLKLNF